MSWNWTPIDLRNIGERPPVRPTLVGLVYPGGVRHVFSGPPEGLKTWAALIVALGEIRGGGTVAYVDFEMNEHEVRDRLVALGADDDDLSRFLYLQPETEATEYVIGELVQWYTPTLTIIDAAAGAYALQGLDDNARREVELFGRSFIEPFRAAGVSTILLDHVTKSAETRGRWAIGSERKVGGADVHLGFEPVVPFGRGRTGLVKIATHKDRFGHLPRPVAAELELRSDPETTLISWAFRDPSANTADDGWRPTHQMQKVSQYLARQAEPVSLKNIEDNVSGKRRDVIRQAVDALVAGQFATETKGPRGARMFAHLREFTSPDLAQTSPGEVTYDLAHLARPLSGGEVAGRRQHHGQHTRAGAKS